ncbi:hypothetical protein CANCADRAFT_58102 [Tortispora caseinolytica NRRL Y-17796]|uniref:Ribosome quality control complex subunit 2 n=1 Tax=Tortispora caseinolytica NRRL Y-17796 TaxID=767744 RepID=A0A1E4TBI7_9ASCO|nr:hypothetical protein CANCADRAFT_58102 [Tortispora caseinolytica NRRL Y-17796]
MKQRFSSLDLLCISTDLKFLENYRIQNIYDVGSRGLLFKFSLPNTKTLVLLDPGYRIHITRYHRTTAASPSGFVAKLRKHLRTRRLTCIEQLGIDRVLVLHFGEMYKLVLEFFAAGNVILLDSSNTILATFRVVKESQNVPPCAVGITYTLSQPTTTWLTKLTSSDVESWSKDKSPTLKQLLQTNVRHFSVDLLVKCIETAKLDPESAEYTITDVLNVIDEAQMAVQSMLEKPITGYIVSKHDSKLDAYIYDDFMPFEPIVSGEKKILSFEGYNSTVDEYFSTLESQKLDLRIAAQEASADRKLHMSRTEHARRIEQLRQLQNDNIAKGSAIEEHINLVSSAIDKVNNLLSQKIDWENIGKLIDIERMRNDPVANVISKLDLGNRKISLSLPLDSGYSESDSELDDSDYDTSDDETDTVTKQNKNSTITVDIYLHESPGANARRYYTAKKSAIDKEIRTSKSSKKALKSAEKKIQQDLQKSLNKEKQVLKPVRNPAWFEKFLWFISSEGYLAIAGRDSQQNDMIYRRYFRPGDLYVHADIDGAATVFLLNRVSNSPIPAMTLEQAGTFSVACSKAWEQKAVSSAWWVKYDQVSKTAPTGEYLNVSGFIISGSKTYIAPAQLVMGFGFLFKVDQESEQRHKRQILQPDIPVVEIEAEQDLSSFPEILEDFPDVDLETIKDDVKYNFSKQDEDSSVLAELLANTKFDTKRAEPSSEQQNVSDDHQSIVSQQDSIGGFNDPAQQAKKSVRGKKGKLKKIAKKYADQDEEEYQLRMEILGSTKGLERKIQKKNEQEKMRLEQQAKQMQSKKIREEKLMEKERRMKMRRNEEGAGIEDDDDDDEIGLSEMESVSLDSITGTVFKEDNILEAIPTFAPWSALKNCKYKVKLVPGTTKKGKAIKECLSVIFRMKVSEDDPELMSPRERDLIKSLRDEEMILPVGVSKVKVMATGMNTSKKK